MRAPTQKIRSIHCPPTQAPRERKHTPTSPRQEGRQAGGRAARACPARPAAEWHNRPRSVVSRPPSARPPARPPGGCTRTGCPENPQKPRCCSEGLVWRGVVWGGAVRSGAGWCGVGACRSAQTGRTNARALFAPPTRTAGPAPPHPMCRSWRAHTPTSSSSLSCLSLDHRCQR